MARNNRRVKQDAAKEVEPQETNVGGEESTETKETVPTETENKTVESENTPTNVEETPENTEDTPLENDEESKGDAETPSEETPEEKSDKEDKENEEPATPIKSDATARLDNNETVDFIKATITGKETDKERWEEINKVNISLIFQNAVRLLAEYGDLMTGTVLPKEKLTQGARKLLNVVNSINRCESKQELAAMMDLLNVYLRLTEEECFGPHHIIRGIQDANLGEKEVTTLNNLSIILKEYAFASERNSLRISLEKVFDKDATIFGADVSEWLVEYYSK